MPELPEVETIRRGLEKKVQGRVIVSAEVRLPKQVRGMDADEFSRRLQNTQIQKLGRRGKFLIFDLGNQTLLIHLGMSGQVTYWDHAKPDSPRFVIHKHTGLQKTPSQHAPDRHTHVLFHLDGEDRIQYRDIRQFGYLRLLKREELASFAPLATLGLEPLGPDYSYPLFQKLLKQKKGMIKALLLSQRPICGLGNIYVDEALHASGIHPRQRVQDFKERDLKALYAAIPKVLLKAIERKGTTLMDFRGAEGEQGHNQNSLQAYGRSGEPCLRCGKTLKRILVSQRSTVFCPVCQKKR